MISRYNLAAAKGKRYLEEAIEEDKVLLDSFGLGLLSVEEGLQLVNKKEVRGSRVNPWDVQQVSGRVWKWLRPLLVELRELREFKARTEKGCSASAEKKQVAATPANP